MEYLDYQNERLSEKLSAVKKQAAKLSVLRVFTFFGLGALLILGIAEHLLWLIPAIGAAWGFIHLIQSYTRAKDQEAIYKALQLQNERKLARQARELGGLDSGIEHADKAHPFAGDLDLFGDHSLYQLINHTISEGGSLKLAKLLKAGFDPEIAIKRGKSVTELRDQVEFLEGMEAIGLAFRQDNLRSPLWKTWLGKEEASSWWHSVLAVVGPLGGVSVLFLIYAGLIPQAFLGLWIAAGLVFLGLVFRPLRDAATSVPLAQQLKSLRLRAEMVENLNPVQAWLVEDRNRLFSGGKKASEQLADLDSLGLWLQNRINLLYLPINLLFWTDFLLYHRLVRWKQNSGSALQVLPEILEDWEVWTSLGSFESELGYSGSVEWTSESLLQVDKAIHPLIHPAKAVGNSLNLGTDQGIVLLTGANMSGKTTFMRTLGINAVLVNLGLRPFAKHLLIGPIQLYTSMRNTDNLGESVSSFYAELHRIRTLINRLEAGEKIVFFLDEILKGTNTQDRISGSQALVRQILKTKGFGIISTHDIELSALEQEVEKVHNYSFHSEIHDQTINFDYTLKTGPCPSFNAHKLMELMGIRFGEQS